MKERDILTKGVWHTSVGPGVVPLVCMEGKLDAATDALADALSTLMQVCPDVYLKKEGLPRVHADVELEAGHTCSVCKRPLRALRVMCAVCRRRPVQMTKGVNYLQLCWEGSHPDLFKKEIWDRSSSANRLLFKAQNALKQCLELETEAVRIDRPNYFMDDIHQAPFWVDDTVRSGAMALTEEVFPLALSWLLSTDGRFFGAQSAWVQSRLQEVAGLVASHASWLHPMTVEDLTRRTEEALSDGIQLWKQHCRKQREFARHSLCALESGCAPPCGFPVQPSGSIPGEKKRLRALLDQLDALEQNKYEFVLQPTAELSADPDVPELPWVEYRRRLRLTLPSAPDGFPMENYRVIRVLALVARMVALNDIPIGVVRIDIFRASLRSVISSAVHTTNLCKFTTTPTDMACAFMRGQALMQRCGPLIEDEVLESVCCLRHFSMSEIGTLVSVELQGVLETLKNKVVSNLPRLWQTRGYREWLQHSIPLVLIHLKTSRGERASLRNPTAAWAGASVLWALPKVREFNPETESELVLYKEDTFGRAEAFLKGLEHQNRLVYKRRVGTRFAMCLATDDLIRIFNNGVPVIYVTRGE